MPRSAAFLLKFFALAGTLFWLWNFAGASEVYSRVVVAVAEPAMWLTSGYHVESATSTDTAPWASSSARGTPRSRSFAALPYVV